MSYVLATPEMVAAAANNLAQIGSTLSAANAAALAPTTGVLAAGADEVSAAAATASTASLPAVPAERAEPGAPVAAAGC